MLADSTSVTVSGSTPPPGASTLPPFLLPPPARAGLMMNPAAYLASAAPFLYGNNALR